MDIDDAVALAGKVVLVTGASRGIGRAVAQRFAAQGATVVVHSRTDHEAAEATLAALPAGDHMATAAEMADPEQVPPLVQRVMERYGRIDVLINNAGIYE